MLSPDDGTFRGWRFETLEDRLALSAQPPADFWYDASASWMELDLAVDVAPLTPTAAHGWSDIVAVRQQFGLRGSGQTVAVIDSGIAYDHIALGGGFGASYKVVGGWDFAENDATPYDDAPAGFHGTHVAGIIGAVDSRYAGVAPDVDLVALRVFDDQGAGYFSWVEQALSWVHENRNRFESPITTVNLSLGTEWNASTLPKWASLEDELKQLADAGIFVSVAAGNSFLVYGSAGLSYPAVSPHVTAVASVDAAGNLSRFSQRAAGVLAAPGERVMSTVPDAFYGGDGVKNDWGAASGTSMAAPYVAGASVLVREAMQNAGHTNITGKTIGDLLHRTADVSIDSATGVAYHRVNITRTLSSITNATVDTVAISGNAATATGTASDDSFTWDAARRQLTVNGIAYSLAGISQVAINGAGGSDALTIIGGTAQETVWLSPGGGEFTSVGFRLTAASVESITFVGDSRDQAWLYDSAGNDNLVVHPHEARLFGAGFSNTVTGVGSLMAVSRGGGDAARLHDSAGNDTLQAGPNTAVFQTGGLKAETRGFAEVVVMATAGGYDTATLQDSPGADELDASSRYVWLRGAGYSIRAEGFDNITIRSTFGSGDVARLYGNEGDDALAVWSNQRTFYSAGVVIQTLNFRSVVFDGGGGQDRVAYYSSHRPGYLYGRSHYGSIADQTFETQFFGVESVLATVRATHKLRTDLAALEYYFQRIGRK